MTKSLSQTKTRLLATSAFVGVSLAVAGPKPAFAADAAPPAPVVADVPVEEIIVRGRFIPDVMRETSEVATVLVPEDLIRQGDDTAAEALTRLSGISLVSGRFVYVRGLGERYSSALLNGSPLPSPEPLQRVVPLDLFPANILAGATVQKSYSAEYPGEFGGGVINLQTVAVPEEFFANVSLSGGWNTRTTWEDGLTYYGSDTDWSSFDDGTRDLPDLVRQAIASGNGRITEGNFTPEELETIGHSFVNAPLNLLQRAEHIPPNFKIDLAGGDAVELGFGQLGAVVVAGYDNSWSTRRGVQEEGIINGEGDIVPETHYDFESTQNDIVLNGLVGLGLDVADYQFRWTNFYVRSTTKEARSREGFDHLAGADVRDDFTEWFARELMSTQGTAYGAFGNLELQGRIAFAKTSRESPYEKGIRYRLVDDEYRHSASQEQNYTRFGTVDDELLSGGFDVTYRLPIGAMRDATLSAGYAYFDNDRDAEQREFRFLATNAALPVSVQTERVDFLLSDLNIYSDGLVLRETTGSDGAAAYAASLLVHAGYAQAEVEVLPLVRIAAGVRYEDATQSVTTLDLFGDEPPPSPPPRDKDYWLPAGSLTWNFYEDMQLRLGASQTIARPQFRELAPQTYLDPDTDRIFIGNPFLVDSKLLNVDARYEWYFGQNQFVALGGFYKNIDKPVELIVNEIGATQQTTFINAPKAIIWGGEIEFRRYFEMPFGAQTFGNFVWFAAGNYTFTKSEVQVEPGDEVFPLTEGGEPAPAEIYVQDGDRLQGQSEHLANFQFGVEDEAMGIQATILVNYASDRISTRGRPGFPDLVVEPGVTLDFTARKLWTSTSGHETEIGFEARNLLDEDFEEFQEQGAGIVRNNQYETGRSFSLSLKYRY
jgi:outer membrane receptor protein involved in Fe transport